MAVVEHPKVRARVEHRSPGRIRARVLKTDRDEDALERVKQRLDSQPGVDRSTVNPRSGSILVEGERTDALHAALDQVLELLAADPSHEAADAGVEASVELVKRLDVKLGELTDGRVSLRWLVPAAFISVGVRQLVAEGLTLGTVPWYVLLYYGVDSFLKLYPEHAPRGRRPVLEVVGDGDG